jgi:hypothetical protein
MTVGELQLEMEIQSLRVRVAELENVVRQLAEGAKCQCGDREARSQGET